MNLLVLNAWKQNTDAVVAILAEKLGILAFEARQKLSAGSPALNPEVDHDLAFEVLSTSLQSQRN